MSINSSQHTTLTPDSTGGVSNGINGNWEGKPVFPYTIGATFTATRHIPPPPFGHGYSTPWPPFKSENFRRLPQLEYCLSRPPMSGQLLPESRPLTITGLLRTGYSFSAQVVVVNGDMVAKIYDPLYDTGFDIYDNKRDVVVLADGDYTREAAAYEQLTSSPFAGVTPDYFGSWTIEVNTAVGDKIYARNIRLILMEWVQGVVMSSIDALLLGRCERERIIGKVLEAESLVYAAGVWHRDVSPRNVILTSSTSSDSRVVIIDFNVSNVLRLSTSRQSDFGQEETEKTWPGRILGPVTRFWDGLQEHEVRNWVPDGVGEANARLWRAFGEREEYVPLLRNGERDECPRVVWEDRDKEGREVEGVAGCILMGHGDAQEDEDEDVVVFKGRCV
jgi:hypothetical protein